MSDRELAQYPFARCAQAYAFPKGSFSSRRAGICEVSSPKERFVGTGVAALEESLATDPWFAYGIDGGCVLRSLSLCGSPASTQVWATGAAALGDSLADDPLCCAYGTEGGFVLQSLSFWGSGAGQLELELELELQL